MGYLYYDAATYFAFDDRLLTHLRTVILGKLNQNESFAFTWSDDNGQHSLWLHPAVPLRFEFDEQATPKLNPAWVDQLRTLANSGGGLRVVDEPEALES